MTALSIDLKILRIGSKGLRITSPIFWTPEDIVAQSYQWDASNLASITDTAGDVDQIDELLGSSEHLAQTGAARMETGTRTHNGMNVFDGDGSEYLKRTGFAQPAHGDIAIFTVAGLDAINQTNDSVHAQNNSGDDWQLNADSAVQFDGEITSSGLGGSPKALTGGPFHGPSVYENRFDFQGAGVFNAYIDSVKRTTDSVYTNEIGTIVDLLIFSNRGEANFPAGFWAETIVTEDVTQATAYRIQGYLAWKWGLVANLPVNHPFKNAPPVKDETFLAGELGVLNLNDTPINPNTGVAWAAGDTYRLAFTSSTSRDATSATIADYDTHVQTAANASLLNLAGVTWKAVVSTLTVDADVNTGTDSGSSEAILDLASNTIANNYADLWDGSIDNTFGLEEDGVTQSAPASNELWTGTITSGAKHATQYMGNGGNVQTGKTDQTTTTWTQAFNRAETDLRPIRGMSPVLTIQEH